MDPLETKPEEKSKSVFAVESNADTKAATGKKVGFATELETFDIQEEEEDGSRQWGNPVDFLMSCISYAVGLGNVWRFPYKCYKNGGGAFLIPYFICWLLMGVPMFYFETSFGQLFRQGGIGVWKAVPMFKGVGLASLLMASLVNVYYAVVISWALLYLFSSFTTLLPWRNCDHWWNDRSLCINESVLLDSNITKPNNSQSASNQFWNDRILDITKGIGDTGGMQWTLLGTLALTWVLVYFIIWRGLHSSGKIIWFTALFPYVLIFILLGYVTSLPGADTGLSFYLTPDISKLSSPTVWVDAGTQVLFSYGIGFSSLIALGCYNKYHHNNQRDALMIGVINSGTSILAGVVVFGSLGFAAQKQGVTIDQVAEQGPGLIFQVYPQIFLEMPISPLWSILFFLMVFVLGLDSQFCQVEGVMAGLEDEFPRVFKNHKKKMTLLFCFIYFLLAWPQIDGGGIYLFQLMDSMAASGPAILWVVFWEMVAIMYIYGIKRFAKGVKHMIGHKTFIKYSVYWWGFCWMVTVPLICVGIFVFSLVNYEPVTYDEYHYPTWGEALGWLMSVASMVLIPGYWIFFLITTPGSIKERFRKGLNPSITPRWVEEFSSDDKRLHGQLVRTAEKGTEIPKDMSHGVHSLSCPNFKSDVW